MSDTYDDVIAAAAWAVAGGYRRGKDVEDAAASHSPDHGGYPNAPAPQQINLKHWTKGGTGLTNFDYKDRPRIDRTIAAYGVGDVVAVSEPMEGSCVLTDHSLHKINGHDASEFWAVYRDAE